MPRLKILKSIEYTSWFPECPVQIEKCNILFDTIASQIVLQLKLRNISNRTISAVYFEYCAFDSANELIEPHGEYAYLDLLVNPGETFGERVAIVLANNKTRYVTPVICKAVFFDGEIWRNDKAVEPYELPQRPLLIDELSADCFQVFEREKSQLSLSDVIKSIFIYLPMQTEFYWICICGQANELDKNCCGRCHTEKQWVFDQTSISHIMDQIKKEKQIKLDKKEHNKRRIKLFGGVSLLALFIWAFISFALPFIRYTHAKDLLQNGNYDSAIQIFNELNDYKDSKIQINDCIYYKALTAKTNGSFKEAIELFSQIADYRDSEELYIQSKYDYAVALIQTSNYNDALLILQSIGSYADAEALSGTCHNELALKHMRENNFTDALVEFEAAGVKANNESFQLCRYEVALEFMKNKDYSSAIEHYSQIVNYKDSASELNICKYTLAKQLEQQGKYVDALAILETIETYQDVSKLLPECRLNAAKELFAGEQFSRSLELAQQVDITKGNQDEVSGLISDCQYKIALTAFNEKDYTVAGDIFCDLLKYSDDVKEYLYQCAVNLYEAGEKATSRKYFKIISSYKDVKRNYLPNTLIITTEMLLGSWKKSWESVSTPVGDPSTMDPAFRALYEALNEPGNNGTFSEIITFYTGSYSERFIFPDGRYSEFTGTYSISGTKIHMPKTSEPGSYDLVVTDISEKSLKTNRGTYIRQ